MERLTPSQTIGPFFHEGLRWAMTTHAPPPGAVVVAGYVLDGDAKPVSDAVLEVWQPDFSVNGAQLPGLQRVPTDDSGRFAFVVPAPRAGPVHAEVTLFARGLLQGLFTRVYLHPADDPTALGLPASVPAHRRATLMATREGEGRYAWDICLQGERETVFFQL